MCEVYKQKNTWNTLRGIIYYKNKQKQFHSPLFFFSYLVKQNYIYYLFKINKNSKTKIETKMKKKLMIYWCEEMYLYLIKKSKKEMFVEKFS